MNPRKNHFGYLIHDVAKQLRRRFDTEAQRHGLTLPQWRVIGQLAFADGVSQVELAGLIETDPMTVSGLVERLESKGLVVRVTDPGDSRAKIVKITDKARSMVKAMIVISEDVYAEAFDGINDADRASMLGVLTRVSTNLATHRTSLKEELA
jgi:MarR family transcriptional regulator for hemolysin